MREYIKFIQEDGSTIINRKIQETANVTLKNKYQHVNRFLKLQQWTCVLKKKGKRKNLFINNLSVSQSKITQKYFLQRAVENWYRKVNVKLMEHSQQIVMTTLRFGLPHSFFKSCTKRCKTYEQIITKAEESLLFSFLTWKQFFPYPFSPLIWHQHMF